MSLNLGTMYATVALNDKPYREGLAGLEKSSIDTFKSIAAASAAFLGLGALVKKTVNAFSDLEEETNKFNVVFAGMGEQTSKVLAQMRKDFGLSEIAAKRMLAGTGDILTGFGFDKETALALSEGAAKLGADIASFSNYAGGASGATNALTKAMLGETESAKMLGVVIRQDSEEYKKLMAQAMKAGVTIPGASKPIVASSEQQAKAVAALALAYQQSPNAIGDFVRSQDSIANQTRILENNFEQLTANIGGTLAPAYRDLLQLTNGLITAYNNLSPVTRKVITDGVALTAVIVALNKTNLLGNANSMMSGVKNLFSGRLAEAEHAKALEEKKRAESAMTTAQLERDLAQQNLDLANNTVARNENALASAKQALANAQLSGDTAAIAQAQSAVLIAEKNLTESKLAQVKATQELTAKQANLTSATKAHELATKHLSKVAGALVGGFGTVTKTLAVCKLGVNGLRGAFVKLNAALGPLGWAILALGAAYSAYSYFSEEKNRAMQAEIDLAEEQLKQARQQSEMHEKEAKQHKESYQRLQELATYEKLSNVEKEEAKNLIKILADEYGNLDIALEGNTVKIKNNQKAWQQLNAQILETKKNDVKQEVTDLQRLLGARYKALFTQLQEGKSGWASAEKNRHVHFMQQYLNNFGANYNAKQKRTALDTLKEMRALAIESNDNRFLGQIEEMIKLAQQEITKLDQYAALKNVKPGDTEIDPNAIKATREEIEKIGEVRWKIEFDKGNFFTQVEMLKKKAEKEFEKAKVFSKNAQNAASWGDFADAESVNMTKKEIEAQQRLLSIRTQLKNLEKSEAENRKRAIEEYENILAKQNEKELRKKDLGIGDIKNLFEGYRKQLFEVQNQMNSMVASGRGDSKGLRSYMNEINRLGSEMEYWQSRLENIPINMSGAWSLESLSAKLGMASKPEEETAKNTKRTKEILEEIKENFNSGVVLA